ncbi:MAG TPA: VOC family protein [Methylomirabilota bacterium]|nr:VOC family protein [Methylomirabilota bacterium]
MSVRAIPEGYHSITPSIVCKNASRAIDFYKEVFRAKEISRMTGPGGSIGHAELQIGDSRLMLSDEFPGIAEAPSSSPHRSSALHIYTENVDALYDRAVKAGCQVESPLQNQFWGDRFARLRDPFGHSWGIAQHIEDVSPQEMERRAAEWMSQMSKAASAKA